jgi:subfamily B ATP-binding cassette protein MsbA
MMAKSATGWSAAKQSHEMRFWFRYLVRPHSRLLVVVFLAMLVETGASIAEPWPLKIILDNVVGGHHLPGWLGRAIGHWSGNSDAARIAVLAAAGVIAIAALAGAASYIDSYVTEIVGQRVAHDLRLRTYHHLQHLSLRFYDKHQVGSLISTLTTDIGTIQDFVSSDVLTIVMDLLTVLGMLVLMLWLRWDFALIAALATPFLLLFVSRYRTAVKRATREVRANQAEMVAVELQGLQAQRVVHAFGAEGLEEQRLRSASQSTLESALKARSIKSAVSPATGLVVSVCTAVVLWRGGLLIMAGVVTVGILTVFLSYLTKFFKPVRDLAKMTTSVAQANVAAERIHTMFQADDVIVDRPNARRATAIRGEIVFDTVSFGYEPMARVLSDVSFTIPAGHLLGVVGPTGSGKSTIISLIPRLYDPTGGVILLDGVDIRDYTVDSLRQSIANVFQDTVLFRATIRENIAYGRPGATADEIEAAAKIADAHEFITAMPKGYDTLVGDRGLTLSGGQRQRIGIARAVIRNSPVLILDEPTASLDAETESSVIEALERAMEGRTVIMVSHRLATLQDAFCIIVMKDGRIAEQGNHEELMALHGVYAELFRAQEREPTAAGASP